MPEREAWTEGDSQLYRELSHVAVPCREEQIATLLTLVPAAAEAPARIVELACGDGLLAAALLRAFPNAAYLGLDGSPSMRERTAARLREFGARAAVVPFDIAGSDWLDRAAGADAVLSSLCVHHLSGDGKRALFRELRPRLAPGGALLLADLVAPARPEVAELFAATWDEAVTARSQALAGGDALRRRFDAARWNWYRHPDPADRPSPLHAQLEWLREAGFAVVDCFWMQAGHAIYGGYRSASPADPPAGRFRTALAIARAAIAGEG